MKKLTQQQFEQRANGVHNNKYSYHKSNYEGIDSKITITCYDHGDFIFSAKEHLKGKICPKCKEEIREMWEKDQQEQEKEE